MTAWGSSAEVSALGYNVILNRWVWLAALRPGFGNDGVE